MPSLLLVRPLRDPLRLFAVRTVNLRFAALEEYVLFFAVILHDISWLK